MDNQLTNEYILVTDDNNCNCLIVDLLKRKFASLPILEKEIIIKCPKPTPKLSIQSKTKTFKRYFNNEIYERYPWICGCGHLSKLFCWPCILFSKDINVWNKYGYSDLNNVSKDSKRHECSQSHICSIVQFKKFKKEMSIENSLNAEFQTKTKTHNQEVTANRYIISKLISAICFLAKQEQFFQGYFEHNEFKSRADCIELLYFLSESDIRLKNHLEKSTVLSGILKDIQNNLMSAISKVLLDKIKAEIHSSKFVSIIIDESTHISSKLQLSTIFRYVDKNSNIQERFVRFTDISSDRTADTIFNLIHNTLLEFECLDKLIAQTYGMAVMSVEHNEVQQKIKNICPDALFVHCYSHGLNVVLSQSVKHIKGCDLFFKRVISFSSFFCKSSKRISLLNCEINRHFPKAAPTQWYYNGRILKMLLKYKKELIIIFTQIMEGEEEWDSDTVINAEVLCHYLKDFEFNFNLHLFSIIFNSANFLFETLQKRTFNILYCSNAIEKFTKFLNDEKNNFDLLWNKVLIEKLDRKRKNNESEKDMKMIFNIRYSEILQTISMNITDRFQDIERLKFMELFNVTKFAEYNENFPDFLLTSLQKSFGNHFNFKRLKSELIYMYSSPNFHLKSIYCIKELIVKDELTDTLTEVFNLIQLICTIPFTSIPEGISFCTVKRIKTFTENNQSEDKMPAHAIISIEKNLFFNLKKKEKFFNTVIDEFSKKECRIKLEFKK